MSEKRKRESFSIEENYQIIKLAEEKMPYKKIMEKFTKIKSHANISRMVQIKDKIKKEYEEGFNQKKKSQNNTKCSVG